MKFNISGKILYDQLQAVCGVINAKNKSKVLDYLFFKMEGNHLRITGFDQANSITSIVELTESEGEGEFAIEANQILSVIQRFTDQPLCFVIRDGTEKVEIYFHNGFLSIPGKDTMKAPAIPMPDTDAKTMIIPASVLGEGIDSTLFAIEDDSFRPILNSIYWDIHEGDITLVSTDTHKLVRYVNREYAPGFESSFIMQSKAAMIIKSIIGENDSTVRLTFDKKVALFEIGDYILSSTAIMGKYPPYKKVIPTDTPFSLSIDRLTIISAIQHTCVSESPYVNVVLDLNTTGVRITSKDPDAGIEAEELLSCNYEGNKIQMKFRGQYLLEVFSNIQDETVVLSFSDSKHPVLFTPLNQKESDEITVLLMPAS